GYSWLGLEGALDRANAAALAERLKARLEEGRQTLVLNLERLEQADRLALAELAKALRRYRSRVRVVVPSDGELAACLAALARIFEPLTA
ncbi:MAG: hypothetical protein KGL53_01090, partial [Elusimicrobia bacterium]|nr:hypothetical protein [Elusimicrobiota bacterium]